MRILFYLLFMLVLFSSCQPKCATCTVKYEGNGSSSYNTANQTQQYCGDELEIMRSKQGTEVSGGLTITRTCQ